MLQAHLRRGIGHMLRLQRVDRARHAGLDVAEGAGAGAGIAQDHHRRRASSVQHSPIFGQAASSHTVARFLARISSARRLAKPARSGRLHPDPVGLALAFRTRAAAERSFMTGPDRRVGRRLHRCAFVNRSREQQFDTNLAGRTPGVTASAMTDFADLLDGYRRFRTSEYALSRDRMGRGLSEGQSPRVMVIACSDSRVDPPRSSTPCRARSSWCAMSPALVPPFEDDAGRHGVSAALEFAVNQLEVPEILVLGHGACGGVAAALVAALRGAPRTARAGSSPSWVDMLDPARERIVAEHGTGPGTALRWSWRRCGCRW